jgi:cytochrome c
MKALTAAAMGLVLLAAAPAQADDAVAAGRALVQMYCTDCHATEMTGESPLAIAPRFRDLHLRYNVEHLAEALVEGIVTAHPEMPQFEFDPDQAAAIIAYLKTLEPEQGGGRPGDTDQPEGPRR